MTGGQIFEWVRVGPNCILRVDGIDVYTVAPVGLTDGLFLLHLGSPGPESEDRFATRMEAMREATKRWLDAMERMS